MSLPPFPPARLTRTGAFILSLLLPGGPLPLGVPLMLGAVVAPSEAGAAPLPFPDRTITLTIVDQDLPEVLNEIGGQGGFRVNVSAAVRGRVHGRLPTASAEALLDRLGTMFGFQWFYDGETVYASSLNESTSKLIATSGVGVDRLWRAMEQLGIADKRWPLQATEESGLALVKGPPRYLAMVEQTLAALAPKPARPPSEVSVFRGSASSPSF